MQAKDMEEDVVAQTTAAKTEECPSLEEIMDSQCELAQQLTVATAFIKCKNTMKDQLVEMRKRVSSVASGVDTMRKELEKMKQQNIRCGKLMTLLNSLDKKILHMTDNVPPKLIQDYRETEEQQLIQSDSFNNVSHDYKYYLRTPVSNGPNHTHHIHSSARPGPRSEDITLKDCKKTLFNDPEVCPVVPVITREEFANLPKYMIGRQTLDNLNNLVSTINQILKSKYGLLHMGKAAARKKGQLNQYLDFKKQEVSDDNGYMYFFTAEDYQRDTDTKLDKTKLNLFTSLRHLRRIREYRTGNLLRYVIIPHQ